MRREANFQTLFRHWLKANFKKFDNCAFELKQTTKNFLPFDAVSEHQLAALLAVQGDKGMLYKIPDDSRGIKPYDMVYLSRAEAYVVIRYPKFFCIILVDSFLECKKESGKKSLWEDEAKWISRIVVEL